MKSNPDKGAIGIAAFFADVFRPLALRRASAAVLCQYSTAIGWLAKALGRPPQLSDLNRVLLELALLQMARVGLASQTLRNMRKRWLAIWRFAAQLGWAAPLSTPRLPRPVPVFRPWVATPPPADSLLAFYREKFRPELRPQISGKELARYDRAINRFHDFTDKPIALADVTPDMLDDFRAWLDGEALTVPQRTELRGALRRIMRASPFADRFPKRDGIKPISTVGPVERQRKAAPGGPGGHNRLPPLVGESGTLLHFFSSVYVPQVIARCTELHRRAIETAFRKLRRCFGRDLRLDELSRETVAEFMAWLHDDGCSLRTIKNQLKRLLAVWRYAEELDQAPPVPRLRKFRLPREQPDAWSAEEMARILDATGRLERRPIHGVPAGQYWRALLLVGYWTALRRGSLLKIRTGDVDLAAGWLYVPAAGMKTGQGKRFRLGADAVEAIRTIWDPGRELLFPLSSVEALRYHFRAIIKLAGVPKSRRPNGQFHKLRRTSITWTARLAGMPQAIALAGHSGQYVTERYLDPSFMPDHDATAWLPTIGGPTSGGDA